MIIRKNITLYMNYLLQLAPFKFSNFYLILGDSNFKLALEEQEEALLVLEALEADAIETQSAKKLVDLMSDDKDNPLGRIMARINELVRGEHCTTASRKRKLLKLNRLERQFRLQFCPFVL